MKEHHMPIVDETMHIEILRSSETSKHWLQTYVLLVPVYGLEALLQEATIVGEAGEDL